jgi:hypothetical protein
MSLLHGNIKEQFQQPIPLLRKLIVVYVSRFPYLIISKLLLSQSVEALHASAINVLHSSRMVYGLWKFLL